MRHAANSADPDALRAQRGRAAAPPGVTAQDSPDECNVSTSADDVLVMSGDDHEAPGFEETYRAHRPALVRLAFLMCGSRDASEDLVQTVFTSAHPRWHTIDNHLAYLKRGVVNLAKDGQRRDVRRRCSPFPQVTEPVTCNPELDETWALIQCLPWERRAVVVLHYYEDLQLVEVARILDRAESTVRSDHRRALDWLREELCHDEND
jgi:RNA polymerase sigma factor (sigma-70 family)